MQDFRLWTFHLLLMLVPTREPRSLAYLLWSLDFGVGVFHDFSCMKLNFGGNEPMQGRALTPQQVREMQEGFDLSSRQARQ